MKAPYILYDPTSTQDTAPAHVPWRATPWLDTETTVVRPDTAWLLHPAMSASEVWGAGSTVSAEMEPRGPVNRVNEGPEPWQTSAVMVVLICFYCYILYRFRRDMMSCLKNIGNTEDTLTLMEGQGADFVYFLRTGMALAILGGASLVMAWLEIQLPRVESYYLFFGAVAAFLCVVVYRRVAFAVMQWLTDDKEAFRQITFINRVDIAFIAVFYTPLAVIIGVSGRLFELGMVVLAGLVAYHFISLYKYFRIRSFSKLQWFLYLCTVEILPVSFIIALAIRKSGIN